MDAAKTKNDSSVFQLKQKDMDKLSAEWKQAVKDAKESKNAKNNVIFGVTYDICQRLASDGGIDLYVQYLCQKSAYNYYKDRK